MRATRAVVLLSGGLDSAVAAALARDEGRELYCLSFGYGQRHAQELGAARAQAKVLGCAQHQVLHLPLDRLASGSLLKARGGSLKSSGKAVPASYISFRNGVFLSLALSWAESVGAAEVWGGWCRTDQGGYPDCRRAFFRAMEKAARLGTKAGSEQGRRVRIVAPLAGVDKAATIALGLRHFVDFRHTWTCYRGGRKPCRACDACRYRAQGFERAGIPDPLLKSTPRR